MLNHWKIFHGEVVITFIMHGHCGGEDTVLIETLFHVLSRYRVISSAYYRNSVGAVLVYDITKQESFQQLEKWKKEINDFAPTLCKTILVGNKSDLGTQTDFIKQPQFCLLGCGLMTRLACWIIFKLVFKPVELRTYQLQNRWKLTYLSFRIQLWFLRFLEELWKAIQPV